MKKIKNLSVGYLFVLPWIIGFLIFTLYPLITSLQYSFNEVIITASGVKLDPIGLSNYVYAFSADPEFIDGLKFSALQLLLQIPIIIVLSVFLAMLLNQKLKGVFIFRTVYFLPVIVLSGSSMKYMTKLGLLGSSTLETESWFVALSGSDFFIFNIISYLIGNISTILWYSGISVLIFLVILQKINTDLYEASEMDGASGWEKFWKVTVPELKMGINLNIIYLVVFISTFEANPVTILIKDNLFDAKKGLGYAAMQSWVYMILIFICMGILMIMFNGIKLKSKKKKRLIGQEKVQSNFAKRLSFKKGKGLNVKN